MDIGYAGKFLSAESLEMLENSQGAQVLFVKIPKRDEVKTKHDEMFDKYHEADKLIHSKRDELKQLDNKGFFDVLVHYFAIRKKRKQLEEEIAKIDNQITDIINEMAVYYREMRDLNKEIDDFKKAIRMYGLTLEDIKNAYYKVRLELEKKENAEEQIRILSAENTSVVGEPAVDSIENQKPASGEKPQNQPS